MSENSKHVCKYEYEKTPTRPRDRLFGGGPVRLIWCATTVTQLVQVRWECITFGGPAAHLAARLLWFPQGRRMKEGREIMGKEEEDEDEEARLTDWCEPDEKTED